MNIDEEIHRLDEEQREVCQKLVIRLTNELKLDYSYLEAIALKESEIDQLKLGVLNVEVGDVDTAVERCEAELNKLKDLQVGVLLTMKSSIWNGSNSLKKLHETRNVSRARHDEQAGLTEV